MGCSQHHSEVVYICILASTQWVPRHFYNVEKSLAGCLAIKCGPDCRNIVHGQQIMFNCCNGILTGNCKYIYLCVYCTAQ